MGEKKVEVTVKTCDFRRVERSKCCSGGPPVIRYKPRFTNASDHEQFGLRTNFPNTKRLG